MELLSRNEEILLLAVHELGANAYGITIRRYLEERLDKKLSVGGIYVPLERLERNGMLRATESAPLPERGGRRRRLYQLTAKGVSALKEVKNFQDQLWKRIPDLIALKTR